MFRNILVAVDGSRDADQALAHAIGIAEAEHARVTLIASPQSPPPPASLAPGPAIADVLEGARAEAEAVLERARDRVPAGMPVATVLREEPIRCALLRQIR